MCTLVALAHCVDVGNVEELDFAVGVVLLVLVSLPCDLVAYGCDLVAGVVYDAVYRLRGCVLMKREVPL